MHEEGDHATKNQLTGLLLQGDGLEERLEQWECILHDQHGRLLLQRLANGPLPHHYFAQIRRKEEAPPFEPTHVEKAQLQKRFTRQAISMPVLSSCLGVHTHLQCRTIEWISFAKQLAKLANLGILDHDGSLLGLRKEPHSEQTGERRREF